MTTSAVLLGVLVRREWGSGALAGSGRTIGAAVVAAAVAIAVGDSVARVIDGSGVLGALFTGVVVGGLTMVVHVLVMSLADRSLVQELRERGRRRRKEPTP